MNDRWMTRILAFVAALALLSVASPALSAQDGRIAGTVRGTDGQPLAGATVQVVGLEIGALTDDQGRFSFSAPAGEHRIRSTLIGFQQTSRTVTVTAGETVRVELVLRPEAVEMDQMVISVAARDTRRRELGTDLGTIDADEVADQSGANNLSDLLTGRATGLSITESSGGAGTASRVRVRGSTSITQDNTPIIYVDGARVSNATGTGPGSFDFANGQTVSRLDDIDPKDIASVQVVKGPTAAALYGSEAAAGVLLIETKQGTEQEGYREIRYSTTQGFSVDSEDYWNNFASLAPFGITDPNAPDIQQFRPIQNPVTGEVFMRHNPLKNDLTDPFRTAKEGEHRVSIQGTSAEGEVGYYASGRFEQEEGTLPNNSLDRFSLRGNASFEAAENLDISVSTSFIEMEVRLPDNDRSAVGMITNGGAGLPLFSFGTLADGSRGDCAITLLAGLPESLCAARQGNLTARFDKLTTIRNEQELDRFIGSTNMNWQPIPWLQGRVTVGADFSSTENINLVPLDPDRPFGSDSDGLVNEDNNNSRTFTFDAATTGSWDLSDRLTLSTTAGAQAFRTETEVVACEGRNFASPSANACDASLTFDGASGLVEEFEVGGFFQQQIGYNDYLFGTGSVRIDDNSSLGEDEDLIISPSANASAVLTSMPFWNLDFVNNLRLRFAWGQAAQAPNPFAEDRTFAPIRVNQGGTQRIGVQPLDPGNPNLSAEESEEFEFGADVGFLDGRFGIHATYFDSETSDAILPTNVAPSTGFTGTQFVNIGKIENQGFEVSLDATAYSSDDVVWSVRFQHSTTDPVISDLGDEPPIIFGLGANHQMHREGFSPGHFWGRVVTAAERDEAGNIVPGSVELAEGNVNDPNRPFDRALGKASPGNEQSISTTVLLFDRLRLFSLFDRSSDFVKLDNSQQFRSPFIPGTTTSGEFALRQANSTPVEQAKMEFGEFTRNELFIQDASFIKWREATLNYRLPSAVTGLFAPLSGASITVGARNLATFTDYDGLDPELSFDGGRDTFNQSEFFTQPPSKRFFATVDLVF